jgi:hypothetical protein
MSEEKKPGQGWEKNGENTYVTKPPLQISKKPDQIAQTGGRSGTSTQESISIVSNNQTGAIDLYKSGSGTFGGDGKPFTSFSPSTNKWTVTDQKTYDEVVKSIGTDGIKKLQNDSKKSTIENVINPTSTNEDKAKITSTEGYKSLSNTIEQDPNSEQVGTVGPESFNQSEVINQGIGAGKLRNSYGYDNRYPLNMKADQDCIKFTMYEYAPKQFESGTGLGGFNGSNENKGKSLGAVTLPIQPQISDSNTVTWGEDSINAIQAAAAAAAYGAIIQGGGALAKSAEDISKVIGEQKGNITAALAAKFAGAAVGANENFLSRTTGAILNNNVELLFQGPSLRSFSFTFLMSAREPKESEAIRKIIRFFKQGMSVKRTNGNLFLKAPNVFDIEYLHRNAPHKYVNKIKTCALQNCSVNYTPDGNYATYEDGAMTQYSLTLSFGEIDPLYDDDYTKLDGDNPNDPRYQIGY